MANNFGIIILAAGKASRLGEPKQLLQYGGKSLLKHAAQIAIESTSSCVIVVLGANANLLAKEIDDRTIQVVINEDWEEGMAASIRCGLNALIGISPSIDGTILMVCDQPYVTTSVLTDLIKMHQETGKKIITCSYENTFGPPAFFHKSIFPEMLQLKGDVGARKIVQRHADEVEVLLFPKGNIDIDTKEDYEKLMLDKSVEG